MPTKLQIAAGALALLAGYELGVRRYREKFNTVAYAYCVAMVENEKLEEKTKYLIHMLEEHEVPLSEFDLIVLTHDVEES
jgi:hypothetical protein